MSFTRENWDSVCEAINNSYKCVFSQEISVREFKNELIAEAYKLLEEYPLIFNKESQKNTEDEKKEEIDNVSSMAILYAVKNFINYYVKKDDSLIEHPIDQPASFFIKILKQKTATLVRREYENTIYGNIFNEDDTEYDSSRRKTWRKCRDRYAYFKSSSKTQYFPEEEILELVAKEVNRSVEKVKEYLAIKPLKELYTVINETETNILETKHHKDVPKVENAELLYEEEEEEEIKNFKTVLCTVSNLWEKEDSSPYIADLMTVYFISTLKPNVNPEILKNQKFVNQDILKHYLQTEMYPTFKDIDKKYGKKDCATNTKKRFLEKIKKRNPDLVL